MAISLARDAPFHTTQSPRRWWLAVYAYVPALILTVVSSLLKQDATAVEVVRTDNIEASVAQTSLTVSFAFTILAQAATVITCWWLAGELLEGSTTARTMLSMMAAVFAISVSVTLVGTISQVHAGDSSVPGLIIAGLLIVAPIVTATATAQSYHGERNQKFFVIA